MIKNKIFSVENSVIVSFNYRWFDQIINGKIGVFFRKRGPSKTPSHVIMYIGAPLSSVVSIAEVEKIATVDLQTSLMLAKLGCISEDELRNYVGEDGLVTAIFIKNHRKFDRCLSISDLKKILNFHPPQNFIKINKNVMQLIEKMGNEKKIN